MPAARFGRGQQAFEEAGGAEVSSAEECPRQRDVVVLAQVVGLVGHRDSSRRRPDDRLFGPALPDPDAGPHRGDGSYVG